MLDRDTHGVSPGDAGSDPRRSTPSIPAQRIAQLLDIIDDGVLSLDRDLEIQYANARWERWVGEPVRAGAPVASLLDGDGESVLRELRALASDGEMRTITLALRSAHADVAGKHVHCTARRWGDELLLEAHADDEQLAMEDIARRLAEVSDMAEVLSTLCDIATRQCDATGASVLRVSGTEGEVVAAAGVLASARGRCFALEGSLLSEVMAEQTLVGEENYRDSGRPLMRAVPDLELGPVIAAPLRAHGETLGVISVARGVGGRQFRAHEMERLRVLADHAALAVHKSLLLYRAQSADRAKGRFLATMSHELRTPLTALAGYNELLVDQVIGPVSDPQLEILERMRSVTSHLSAMIEEILSFTNLEQGHDVVRPTEFLVADLVRAAIAVVQPMADQKKLRIELVEPRGHVRVTSDIDKSRQILVNLLGNAVKFTDAGAITVRMTSTDATARVEVQDTGIGVSPDELARLFRPFTQVDSGLTRRHGGTGLGLYISRRLATMLGGRIDVVSVPGRGSTFSFELPLRYDDRS
jgi:signal transduction histidine kinase